jgi:hypothetical protein
VSEVGEVGSPAQIPFTAALVIVAACLLGFAVAPRNASRDDQVSALPAYLVACSSISAACVGWFAYPHPLHNVFGPSELIGYQAPLAFALTCATIALPGHLLFNNGDSAVARDLCELSCVAPSGSNLGLSEPSTA